jgi:PIN domain
MEKVDIRVSSRLLEIESYIGLVRHHEAAAKTNEWLKRKSIQLDIALEEIFIHSVDAKIFAVLKTNPIITKCRSLDAIHLATALLFKANYGMAMSLFSYDKNMNKNALALGFEIISKT